MFEHLRYCRECSRHRVPLRCNNLRYHLTYFFQHNDNLKTNRHGHTSMEGLYSRETQGTNERAFGQAHKTKRKIDTYLFTYDGFFGGQRP